MPYNPHIKVLVWTELEKWLAGVLCILKAGNNHNIMHTPQDVCCLYTVGNQEPAATCKQLVVVVA